jgi:hypothetical protein
MLVRTATMNRATPKGGDSMSLGVAAEMGVSGFYSIGVSSIIGDEGCSGYTNIAGVCPGTGIVPLSESKYPYFTIRSLGEDCTGWSRYPRF